MDFTKSFKAISKTVNLTTINVFYQSLTSILIEEAIQRFLYFCQDQKFIMWSSLIQNLSRFVVLTNDDVEIIQSLFSPKKFRKHQYILQEGDISRWETYVVSGLTRTYEIDDKGQEHVIQFGAEDWWIGDLFSFLTETPSRFNVDCLEDTQVLQITKPDLDLLYQKVPATERHFRIMIQNAYIASTNRISSTLRKTAPERYNEFMLRYPQIEQRVRNHQIASYLGITPQSLSRIRSKVASGS